MQKVEKRRDQSRHPRAAPKKKLPVKHGATGSHLFEAGGRHFTWIMGTSDQVEAYKAN